MKYGRSIILLFMLVICSVARAQNPLLPSLNLSNVNHVNVADKIAYYQLDQQTIPSTRNELAKWIMALTPHHSTKLNGDRYIAAFTLHNDTKQENWFIYPYGSVIENIHIITYGSEATTVGISGYNHRNKVNYHYGDEVYIPAGKSRDIVILFDSQFFFAPIKLVVAPQQQMEPELQLENTLLLLCLGVCIALGLYNLFLYIGSRQRVYIFYAFATLSYAWGWAHVFGVIENITHQQYPNLLMLPYNLGALFSCYFTIEFLQLKRRAPRLYKLLIFNAIFAAIACPLSIASPANGLILASISTSIVLILGLYAGIASWRKGFSPAKYFVIAFMCVVLPNIVGNLMNLGILPGLNVNIYLLGLIGNTMDSLLLAFAVANKVDVLNLKNNQLTLELENKIKELHLLNSTLEQKVEERTTDLQKQKHKAEQAAKLLEHLANIDPVTQIANRRRFNEVLALEWRNALRNKSCLSIIMVDIDNFKQYNDHYGHAAGDEVLQKVADVLRQQLKRPKDLVARFGGEEFIIILPDIDKQGGFELMQQCCHAIENLNIKNPINNTNSVITISVGGTSCIVDNSIQSETLLKIADDMMYQAKKLGKNNVVWST